MAAQSIVIGGDFVVDQHLYEGRRHQFVDVTPGVGMVEQTGGAALVCDLVKSLVGSAWNVHCTATKPSDLDPSNKAYAFWRPSPRKAPIGEQYWRCSEAMGFGQVTKHPPLCEWPTNESLPGGSDILVFSEGGMGFRDTRACWEALNFDAPRCIVLKTAAPVGEGAIWEKLDDYSDKLVVIVSASDLRQSMVRISSELSWEASVQDLLREVWSSPDLVRLRRCKHLLVTFGSEAGVWLDFKRTSGRPDASQCRVCFVYDAGGIEGDHSRKIEGTAFGYLSCVAAAAVWQLTLPEPDLCVALYGGLSAMHDLRMRGHGPAIDAGKGFPFARLAGVIKEPQHAYSRAVFINNPSDAKAVSGSPRAVAKLDTWSLLEESRRANNDAFELARLVLLRGPIALANLPHLSVGYLLSIDRQEIESLRTIAQLIRHYKDQEKPKTPLSLGIFGPPGSGKSFAVSQLANELIGKDAWLEFNLSQFADKDLIGAFHQIRDRVLQGQLPVAFFDEFDAGKYKWLQYLLAPMQDGKFQEGQITHTLGKCILVFAGATGWTFETFGPPEHDSEDESQESTAYGEFRLAKGPDFKSRLDDYLDVTGPNPKSELLRIGDKPVVGPKPKGETRPVDNVAGYNFVRDATDLWYPIRRALMIRTKLGCAENDKLEIDEGVLAALLQTERYTHGARSLDKVLQPLKASRPGSLRRSFLPPRGQLAMHVNAKEFFDTCGNGRPRQKAMALDDSLVAKIAPAIHETWRRLGLAAGWIKPKGKEDCTYADLPTAYDKDEKTNGKNVGVFLQESNQAAARRMPVVLDLIGLRLETGQATGDEEELVRQTIEYHLELLAEAEHYEWMKWYLAQGWREGPKKDYPKQLHNCLVPFAKLKEGDRNKDRDSIRHYLDFARGAGMRIL